MYILLIKNDNIMHTSYIAIYARMMTSSRAAQTGKHQCDANSILPSILYLLSSNLSDMLFFAELCTKYGQGSFFERFLDCF